MVVGLKAVGKSCAQLYGRLQEGDAEEERKKKAVGESVTAREEKQDVEEEEGAVWGSRRGGRKERKEREGAAGVVASCWGRDVAGEEEEDSGGRRFTGAVNSQRMLAGSLATRGRLVGLQRDHDGVRFPPEPKKKGKTGYCISEEAGDCGRSNGDRRWRRCSRIRMASRKHRGGLGASREASARGTWPFGPAGVGEESGSEQRMEGCSGFRDRHLKKTKAMKTGHRSGVMGNREKEKGGRNGTEPDRGEERKRTRERAGRTREEEGPSPDAQNRRKETVWELFT